MILAPEKRLRASHKQARTALNDALNIHGKSRQSSLGTGHLTLGQPDSSGIVRAGRPSGRLKSKHYPDDSLIFVQLSGLAQGSMPARLLLGRCRRLLAPGRHDLALPVKIARGRVLADVIPHATAT
jgi:hypothetical protein